MKTQILDLIKLEDSYYFETDSDFDSLELTDTFIIINKMIPQHLNQKQKLHYEAIKWLLSPKKFCGEGRTRLMSVIFLEIALENRNTEIKVFDHSGLQEIILEDIIKIFDELSLEKYNLELIINPLSSTIFISDKKKNDD